MTDHEHKHKQPVAGTAKIVDAFGLKLAKLLALTSAGNAAGSLLAVADIANEALKRRLEVIVNNLAIAESRGSVLREAKAIAKLENLNIDLDDLEKEAWLTIDAGFDFDSLVDNLGSLPVLPVIWNAKRTVPRWRGDDPYTRFHDLMVVENIRALIPLLKNRPEFQDWLLTYVSRKSKRLEQVSSAITKLLSEETEQNVEFEKHYRDAVVNRCNKVELFIRHDDLGNADREQELGVAYVSLTLSNGDDSGRGSTELRADRLLESAEGTQSPLLVLGNAGSGKTTLLRWIAIQAAMYRIPENDEPIALLPAGKALDVPYSEQSSWMAARAHYRDWRDRIPFLIRLRDYQAAPFPEPSQFHQCSEVVRSPSPQWSEAVLKHGRALVLVDGLDELRPQKRIEALAWIGRLRHDYSPDNVFVVTSRPEALSDVELENIHFVRYEVRDLSPSDRVTFVENWHRAVALKLSPNEDIQEKHKRDEQRMLEQLEVSLALAQLASNPLLCSLLCALNRVHEGRLPENLYELCTSACKMLLVDRDRVQGIETQTIPSAYRELSPAQRLHVVQQIAYDSVVDNAPLLTRSRVLRSIRSSVARTTSGDEYISDIFDGLLNRSGLIRMAGKDGYEFVHNTLRDYLASLNFAENDEFTELVQGVASETDSQRWEPVLLFAAASDTHRAFVHKLLRLLLQYDYVLADRLLHRQLLALRAKGATQYNVPQDLEARLREIENNVLPINTNAKAEAIAATGVGALEFLMWHRDMQENEAAACVHGLAQLGGPVASQRLKGILHFDRRPRVLNELAAAFPAETLAAVVNVLDIPSIVVSAQGTDGIPASFRQYVNDLSPLGQWLHIQSLYLQGTQVRDLSPVAKLANLHSLVLEDTPVLDLQPISRNSELRGLAVPNTNVINLGPLSGLRNLQTLMLSGTSVSDLTPLGQLFSLESLFLDNTKVSNLVSLASLRQLQWLSIRGTPVADVTPLRGMHNLQRVLMENTSAVDLSPLRPLRSLEQVSVTGSQEMREEGARLNRMRRTHGLPPVTLIWK